MIMITSAPRSFRQGDFRPLLQLTRLPGGRLYTVTAYPFLSRLQATFAPMMPRPRKAIFSIFSPQKFKPLRS
jgi:hypothetical protein